MNSIQLAVENLENYGEYTSTHFEGQSFTNLQLTRRAQSLATVLRDRGVGPGDLVVVMMPNCPDVMAAFQAIWRIGAVIVPITPQLGPFEVHHVLADSEAIAAITSHLLAPVVQTAAEGVNTFHHLLAIGETDTEGVEDIAPEIKEAEPISEIVDRADHDLAVLLYTSGTTGPPKGVMLTHSNILSNARSVHELAPNTKPQTIELLALPLSHSFGILMMNLGAMNGSTWVVLPRFDVEKVFQVIEQYRVESVALVPTMMTYMLDSPNRDAFDTSSLSEVNSGGAALAEMLRVEIERVFDCRVNDAYGMSECTTAVCAYRDGEAHRPGSVGRAIPDVEIKIVDTRDNCVGPGEEGEICVKGPSVMKGYWKKEEDTRHVLRGGWMHSGDLGHIDDDGYIFVTGRLKEMIIKGGANVSPNELEEVILKHPAVMEVAVIGVPDATFGENIWAVAALHRGRTVTEDEIKNHTGRYLTRFKIPARVLFRDDLPKTHSGKILKSVLRKEMAEILERKGGYESSEKK